MQLCEGVQIEEHRRAMEFRGGLSAISSPEFPERSLRKILVAQPMQEKQFLGTVIQNDVVQVLTERGKSRSNVADSSAWPLLLVMTPHLHLVKLAAGAGPHRAGCPGNHRARHLGSGSQWLSQWVSIGPEGSYYDHPVAKGRAQPCPEH